MARDSRRKMVETAAALIGSRGIAATSFSEVLSISGAPRGSIYHHFPGGKRELAADAMRFTRDQILAYQKTCHATTASGILDHFVAVFRESMVRSKCAAGCPVAGVLVDTYSPEDGLVAVGKESFEGWIALLARQLQTAGLSKRSSRALATTTLASIEGALILCRATGNVRPLDVVNDQLRALARTAARSH